MSTYPSDMILQVVNHKDYTQSGGYIQNNLALLRLAAPFNVSI